MLNKQHNSIVSLAAVLLALVGVSKPAKAFLLAQTDVNPTNFTVPDELPAKATVEILTSNSTSSISQSLKESFISKFPQAQVNIETQSSDEALKALSEGTVNLVGIGRNLTAAERQQGLVAVPVSREKIAVVVSPDNPYDGNLTISQFARIFRGEITDWSEIGGQPGEIKLVDSPDANDTRQAFPNYPVFQDSEFTTGSNAVKVERDNTDEMIARLGTNGIGYAVANDVINRDDVKIVTMHQTQPDDERYPFSQPFYLVYQGTPDGATEAFLGFATEQGGEDVVASRVGSMSTAAAVAIATKLGNKPAGAPTGTADLPETTLDGEGNLVQPDEIDANVDGDVDADDSVAGVDTDANVDGDVDADDSVAGVDTDANVDGDVDADDSVAGVDTDANVDADDSVAGVDADANVDGDVDTDDSVAGVDADANVDGDVDTDTLAQADAELEGSGQTNPELEGAGEVNPDLEGSGEINPDLEELENSGEPSAVIGADEDNAVATTNEGKWWWWLPLILGIPILAAIAVSGFGGKKRSDREPAIGNVPDINPPDGGGVANIPDGGNLSAVGATTETKIGNAATNTNSQLGSTAIAGSAAVAGGTAAAANFVAERRTRENDLDDIRLDDSDDLELSNTDIDEIPSNPVAEFTGQETKLQGSEQSTRLQADDVAEDIGEFTGQETKLQGSEQSTRLQADDVTEDIDESSVDLTDSGFNVGNAAGFGGAVAGGAAASGLFGNREDIADEELDSSTIDRQTDFASEQTTKLQTTDLDSEFDTTITDEHPVEVDRSSETQPTNEFEGDFVLDEETDGTFVNVDSEVDEINLDTTNSVSNRLNEIDTNVSGSNFDTANDVQTPELNTDVDRPTSNDSGFNVGNAAGFGGAAVAGGAAASGLFGNREDIADEDLDSSNIDSQTDFVSEQTTKLQTTDLDSRFDSAITDEGGIEAENFETNDFDTNVEEINLDNVDTDIEEIALDETASARFDDFETNVSDFSFDTTANTQTPELDTDTDKTDIDLDSIETASARFDDFETNVSDFSFDTTANTQTPELDTDIEDTKIDDPSGSIDGRFSAGSAAVIGGAAASGLFGNRDRTETSETDTDIEEVDLDTDVSSTSTFNDNIIGDAQTTSEDFDISLDEITFDDADDSINASLEEIDIESVRDSTDTSLDEITFDDADNSINASLEEIDIEPVGDSTDTSLDEITFDDADSSADINLDDLTFDDTKDSSLNLATDETDVDPNNFDISLDDLGFDTSADDTNIDLLSSNAAKIADSSEDRDDMNNISTWLDSLETPSQSSEDISGWLDRLNNKNNDSQNKDESDLGNVDSEDEIEDISFQFLEDLLERDSEASKDNS